MGDCVVLLLPSYPLCELLEVVLRFKLCVVVSTLEGQFLADDIVDDVTGRSFDVKVTWFLLL